MSFRFRIAAWVVVSCTLLTAVMMFTGYRQLEEELREGRKDPTHPGTAEWTIHNSYAEDEIREILTEMTRSWLWTGVPVIALSLFAGLLLARRALRPVHDINRQLTDMRPDSLHGGIKITEADPVIGDLANHLNGLLEKAGTAYQEMAEFSARVAHELRTPLMLLRLRIENAPPGMPPAFQEELQDELARLTRFVERALLATKAEQGALRAAPTPLNLSDTVRDISEQYQLLASERPLGMTVEIEPDICIDADSDLLRQAIHGLLENAVRYAKSEITICCAVREGCPELGIRNDVDPVTIATAGLGLGLRLVRGICKACGWCFDCHGTDDDFRTLIHFDPTPPNRMTNDTLTKRTL
jgi:signal transduction histidine kinase